MRKSTYWFAGLSVLLVSAATHAQPDRAIAADAAKADLALARRAIELIHPGLDRYVPRATIDREFELLAERCGTEITEREFFAGLSRVLAAIRCSHTKAEPSEAWTAWRSSTPTYVPFRFVEHEGRMFVTHSAVKELSAGDEIVRLDGVPAGMVLTTILGAVPADGWTDGARRFALSSTSDFEESEFDHFFPAFFSTRETIQLEIRQAQEATSRMVDVPMMTLAARQKALAQPAQARNLDEAVSLEITPSGVGVLRVGTFVAYRKKIQPADIYRPLFERLAAERVTTLILDMRDNGGGSDDAARDLMRFLCETPVDSAARSWVRAYRFGDLTEKLETWDRSVLSQPEELFTDLGNGYFEFKRPRSEPLPPLRPTFAGRLIVLCGPANASGATLFLAGLRERRAMTLIGEPTGGNAAGPTAGIILFLPLPNTGIKVRIPAIRSVTPFASANPAGGLEPDVLVRPTLRDRLAGRDIVLERALELALITSVPAPEAANPP